MTAREGLSEVQKCMKGWIAASGADSRIHSETQTTFVNLPWEQFYQCLPSCKGPSGCDSAQSPNFAFCCTCKASDWPLNPQRPRKCSRCSLEATSAPPAVLLVILENPSSVTTFDEHHFISNYPHPNTDYALSLLICDYGDKISFTRKLGPQLAGAKSCVPVGALYGRVSTRPSTSNSKLSSSSTQSTSSTSIASSDAATESRADNRSPAEKMLDEYSSHYLYRLVVGSKCSALFEPEELLQYIQLLHDAGVRTTATFLELSIEDLVSVGIPLGHAMVLTKERHRIKQKPSSSISSSQQTSTNHPPTARLAAVIDGLRSTISQLSRGLVGRKDDAALMVLAALCSEHVLLLGPPGVAKSVMCSRMENFFDLHSYQQMTGRNSYIFSRLLTKYTLPEEIFGPLSIQQLKLDRHVRRTEFYLPDAPLAFLDEIFKSNSAILNSLLTILNERQFDNGHERKSVPLLMLVAASNEYPESGELLALYDRFVFRMWIQASKKEADVRALLLGGDASQIKPEVGAKHKIDASLLAYIQECARAIEIPDEVLQFLYIFWMRLGAAPHNIYISPRRLIKMKMVLQVCALCHQRKKVELSDCVVLQHLAWHREEQRSKILDEIINVLKLTLMISGERTKGNFAALVDSHIWINESDRKTVKEKVGEPPKLPCCPVTPLQSHLALPDCSKYFASQPKISDIPKVADIEIRVTYPEISGRGAMSNFLIASYKPQKGPYKGRTIDFSLLKTSETLFIRCLTPIFHPCISKIDDDVAAVYGISRDASLFDALDQLAKLIKLELPAITEHLQHWKMIPGLAEACAAFASGVEAFNSRASMYL